MNKQTVLEDVKARMKSMQDSKAEQLETIKQKQEEARAQIEAEALAMKHATEDMDVDRYEEAKNKKHKAQTALDMYSARYEQIKQQEYISEAESDKVIDALLEYEEELADEFRKAASALLKQLHALHADYTAAVKDTESTIETWQREIHANYNTRGAASYYDELTGRHTNRSPEPYPVHRLPCVGCAEAVTMGEYLEKAEKLYKQE